jgi:lipopolysaccharide transport system permease protein
LTAADVVGNRRRGAPSTDEFPQTVIKPSRGWVSLGLGELWRYRELVYFLTWRDVKVRYKQTVVGIFWVVLQPLLTMLLFTFVFGRLAKLPSAGIPYPLFVYSGLLPWQLFSSGITGASASIVANASVISKVYFPRLIIPLAVVLGGFIDFVVAFSVLIGLMLYYGFLPGKEVIALPAFVLLAMLTAFAVGLWLSMLNVKYRDVQFTIPFLTQIWLFATPVAYASSLIPSKYRILFGLNPMTSVVDGFRWALLGQEPKFGVTFVMSLGVVFALLFSGLIYFRRAERTFADVI